MINLLDNLICSLKNRALDVEILNPVTMLLTRDEIKASVQIFVLVMNWCFRSVVVRWNLSVLINGKIIKFFSLLYVGAMNTDSFFFSRLVDSRSYVEEVEQANQIQRYMYLQHSSSLIHHKGAVMIIIQPFYSDPRVSILE